MICFFLGKIIHLDLEPFIFSLHDFDKSSWEIHYPEFKNFQAVSYPWTLNTLAQMVSRFFNIAQFVLQVWF